MLHSVSLNWPRNLKSCKPAVRPERRATGKNDEHGQDQTDGAASAHHARGEEGTTPERPLRPRGLRQDYFQGSGLLLAHRRILRGVFMPSLERHRRG